MWQWLFLTRLREHPLVVTMRKMKVFSFFFFPIYFFISWRLITLQYCSGFCHTLTWISHGFTCVPHPDLPSHLPLHPIPLGLPGAPGPSTCLMHPTWAGDLLDEGIFMKYIKNINYLDINKDLSKSFKVFPNPICLYKFLNLSCIGIWGFLVE